MSICFDNTFVITIVIFDSVRIVQTYWNALSPAGVFSSLGFTIKQRACLIFIRTTDNVLVLRETLRQHAIHQPLLEMSYYSSLKGKRYV